MPSAAPRPCRRPGCGVLSRDGSGYCPAHQVDKRKLSGFDKRLSRHERGYGSAWDKLRPIVFRRDAGLCQPCKAKGLVTAGTICDHIVPKNEGGTDDLDNLQTICKRCHTLKTAKESARGGGHVAFEPEWLPAAKVPVVVVCGPPGSGKTTYVKERAGRRRCSGWRCITRAGIR